MKTKVKVSSQIEVSREGDVVQKRSEECFIKNTYIYRVILGLL